MQSDLTEFQTLVGRWLRVEPNRVLTITNGVNKNLRAMINDDDVFVRFSPASLHSKCDLAWEATALKNLRLLEVPCCEIIEIDGQQILGPATVNGVEYNALVNRTIAGPLLALVPADAKAFGCSLARLHRASVDLPLPQYSDHRAKRVDPVLNTVFRELTELEGTFQVDAKLKVGICHGDAWLGNAIMKEGIAVLFDFEFIKVGALAYDIATFIWALRAASSEEEGRVFKSFVEGYREECNNDFSEDELKSSLVRREINNIEFLSENIIMSREVKLATAQFARDTIDFVSSDEFAQFRWT
ncbi:phosphotransferase enzyme family protein [Rhizobium leguminosarum]|uniref:phosphotransferase enzyme family protein n=1 Tax=Rhizobium leguminosarum TaxID=384 RepID=UPI001C907443|nr:phosphotransferase [Rhizobium leguminosarum]MBY3027461.1 phosphotransferase [Rhizobium leguminosarum]